MVGVLTLTADVAYRECHGRIEEQSLHVGSPIQLDYCGYLQAAFRWVGSPGETTIRIGQWPEMAVRIRQQQQAQTLQQLLQAWYERRVPVWEMVGGQRTFLLKQNLSYEQIRAFEQQYGVKLYG
ncbi:hypothetical protein ASU33_00780 [Solirubrum puertoriconensis]|uniref:Uncharacterized protein n=1 Tax=Solirubrum puertoriconensis TaxID=1751427 RepID=A0A9X0HHI2_SOLP1|nr:hypothetical protein ASU33_00780 [Solirubrum puertoriconensis]